MSNGPGLHEIVPVGGSWSGMLFENPASGYPLTLTWQFHVECQPIHVDPEATSCNVHIDWVPNLISSWHHHGGMGYRCQRFAEPIESSVHYFDDHRYDHIEIAIVEQSGGHVLVDFNLTGDIDGLGLPAIQRRAALDFTGIIVVGPDTAPDLERDAAALREFTDISDMTATARGSGALFLPSVDMGIAATEACNNLGLDTITSD